MKSDLEIVAGSAELIYLGLIESEFGRDVSLSAELEEVQKYIVPSLAAVPFREKDDSDDEVEIISCNICCRLWVEPTQYGDDVSEEDSYASGKLKIGATYMVAFKTNGTIDISDQSIEKFFSSTGIMAVWPYFRSHCSHLASEAGVELPILPLRKAEYAIRKK